MPSGARVLESPMKRVACVAYRVNVVRVVDSRTAKKKATVTGVWGVLGGLASVIPWLCSFATTAQVRWMRGLLLLRRYCRWFVFVFYQYLFS